MKEQLTDQLITEKTANLAEEKGFEQAKTLCQYKDDEWNQGYTLYCTQSLLVKWLRKKHNIIVDIFQESKNKTYTGYWKGDISYYMVYQEDELPEKEITNKDFPKTLELTIFEALKLIKIC